MSVFKNMSIGWKLGWVILLFAAGFAFFGWFALDTLERYTVNGPLYQRIIQGKDVIADVLPPPEYLVESYLIVFQVIDETDPGGMEALLARSKQLRKEYLERHAFWAKDLEAGPLKDLMVTESYKHAIEFLRVRDEELIPAALRGDRARAKEIALTRLKPLYDSHRAAVDEIVRQANERNAVDAVMLSKTDENIKTRTDRLKLLGFLIVVVAAGIGWLIGVSITSRVQRNVDVLNLITAGDLSRRVEVDSQEEMGKMGAALNQALDRMSSAIRAMQRSGIDVASASTQLAATAREQEASASEQAASTMEVVSTARQITATTKELVDTIGQVARVSDQSAALAGEGQEGLKGMRGSMDQMLEAAASIMSKLTILREKATNITSVITTINKVADQTNLLSLNAAIEAEKAGEFGRGFRVVATEIRRLADQTALSTLDIEQMIKEMQSSVSTAVMGMNKFTEEIRQGVGEVRRVTGQLAQIIEQVQNLSPRLDMVSQGMQTQLQGSQQISEAMGQLGQVAQQTADSVRQSGASVHHLKTTAQNLQHTVSLFKVDSNGSGASAAERQP